MDTADDYHRYARECLESAARATSEIEREQFIHMARAWTMAALKLAGAPVATPAQAPNATSH
jgi:hypothetical protein